MELQESDGKAEAALEKMAERPNLFWQKSEICEDDMNECIVRPAAK